MLAERVAGLVPGLTLTAVLVSRGKEIDVLGYARQVANFKTRGAVAFTEVTFSFDAPFHFDAIEYREGDDVLHTVPVTYAGPSGEFTDRLEIEVGASST